MNYDTIIFDSDGVLVEPTDPAVHRTAVRKAFLEFGVVDVDAETVEYLVEITGDERDKLSAANVRRVCEEFGIEPEQFWRRREQLAVEAQAEEVERGRKCTYPDVGVVNILDAPGKDLTLAVVSNNQAGTVTNSLEAFDLAPHFDAIYGREPTLAGLDRRKPDTYYAEKILTEFGGDQVLFVGDSIVDIQTADRLGIDSAFLHRDHRASYQLTESPKYEIDGLEGLLEIVS
ncbi:HAD family hydrolase [Halobellus ordinarius]|uniref:HAD family hydrolase n=1 Tax=Halobellus ordinarius TaxID=3075120 RepID=UPI0028801A3B|nr:HAD-IA family hydrolase [Halobellus sp. ZY16]